MRVALPPEPAGESAIGPLAGRGALEARAAELLGETSVLKRKAHLIHRELRSIGQIIAKPLDEQKL